MRERVRVKLFCGEPREEFEASHRGVRKGETSYSLDFHFMFIMIWK